MAGVPSRLLDHVQQYPSQIAVCERGPGAGRIEVPLSSDLAGDRGLLVKAGHPVLDGVMLINAEVLGIHLVFGHLELGKLTRKATPRHDILKPPAFPQRAVLE